VRHGAQTRLFINESSFELQTMCRVPQVLRSTRGDPWASGGKFFNGSVEHRCKEGEEGSCGLYRQAVGLLSGVGSVNAGGGQLGGAVRPKVYVVGKNNTGALTHRCYGTKF
jgi:hypothetical protein